LIVTLALFQLLMNPPRLFDFQHFVPAPSKLNGDVIVASTGLHAPETPLDVAVAVAVARAVAVAVAPVVAVAVGRAVAVGVALPVVALNEKPLEASPCPPCQTSNPASASSRYQAELVVPRETLSWRIALMSRLVIDVAPGVKT